MTDAAQGSARELAYAALCVVIVTNVLGNIFIKLGSSVDTKDATLLGVFGWQTIAGIALFASGVLFYAWALKVLPLYIAQAVAALQFIGAIVAAAVIFGEAITGRQWIGIALIFSGLGFISR